MLMMDDPQKAVLRHGGPQVSLYELKLETVDATVTGRDRVFALLKATHRLGYTSQLILVDESEKLCCHVML